MANIKLGASDASKFYLGGTLVSAVYLGGNKVWPTEVPIVISGATAYSYASQGTQASRVLIQSSALAVSGGNGTYTYAWTNTSNVDLSAGGGYSNVTCSDTAALNPNFGATCSAGIAGDVGRVEEHWRLTVTSGTQTATYDITVTLEYTRT